MNPTEHDKQIAREAAEKLHCYRVNEVSEDVERDSAYAVILSAITTAKQQQNEDTARLKSAFEELRAIAIARHCDIHPSTTVAAPYTTPCRLPSRLRKGIS